jgi:hypothetical protein
MGSKENEMSREQLDKVVQKMMAALPGDKKTRQRLVRALLRAAARQQYALGYDARTLTQYALKAAIDVANEQGIEKVLEDTKTILESASIKDTKL